MPEEMDKNLVTDSHTSAEETSLDCRLEGEMVATPLFQHSLCRQVELFLPPLLLRVGEKKKMAL